MQPEMFPSVPPRRKRPVSSATSKPLQKVADSQNYPPVGEKGEFRWIAKNKLIVDHRAQREIIRWPIVNEIKNNFRWDCFQVITVLERRNGELVTAEGQHRELAVEDRDDITELPCMVFKSKGLKHEAEVFNTINSKKTRSSPRGLDMLKVGVTREDPISMQVVEVMGWLDAVIVNPNATKNPYGLRSFSSVNRLEEILNSSKLNIELLKATCEQIKEITNFDVYIPDELWVGLYNIALQTNGLSLTPYWTKRFKDIGYDEIIRAARKQVGDMGKSRGSAGVWAYGIAERGNYRLHPDKRLDVSPSGKWA